MGKMLTNIAYILHEFKLNKVRPETVSRNCLYVLFHFILLCKYFMLFLVYFNKRTSMLSVLFDLTETDFCQVNMTCIV